MHFKLKIGIILGSYKIRVFWYPLVKNTESVNARPKYALYFSSATYINTLIIN